MAASYTQLSCCWIVVQYSCTGKTLSKEVPSTRSPTVSTTATLTFWRCHTIIIQKRSKKVLLICKGHLTCPIKKQKKNVYHLLPPIYSSLPPFQFEFFRHCHLATAGHSAATLEGSSEGHALAPVGEAKVRPGVSDAWSLLQQPLRSFLMFVGWETYLTKQWTARKVFTLMYISALGNLERFLSETAWSNRSSPSSSSVDLIFSLENLAREISPVTSWIETVMIRWRQCALRKLAENRMNESILCSMCHHVVHLGSLLLYSAIGMRLGIKQAWDAFISGRLSELNQTDLKGVLSANRTNQEHPRTKLSLWYIIHHQRHWNSDATMCFYTQLTSSTNSSHHASSASPPPRAARKAWFARNPGKVKVVASPPGWLMEAISLQISKMRQSFFSMNHCAGWICLFWVLSVSFLFHVFAYLKISRKCLMSACLISYHVYIIYISYISDISYIFKSWTPFDLLCLAGCVFAFEMPGVLGYLVQVQSITLTMMILMLVFSSFTCYIRHIPKTDVQSQNVPVQYRKHGQCGGPQGLANTNKKRNISLNWLYIWVHNQVRCLPKPSP